jgi:CheY-like chemotaxis protein
MDNLFKKYARLPGSGDAPSTGLGLVICRGIVEAHGGRIWAKSDGADRGATFSFNLPVAAPAAQPAEPQAKPHKARILAVEDEAIVLTYIRRTLEDAGYSAFATANPNEVMKLVEEHRPALMLLDLRLPGISGFDLLKRIWETSSAPLIFITASDSHEDIARAVSLGGADYLVKPFSASELLARIEAAIRRHAEKQS